MTEEKAHVLDTDARPAACSCGKAKYAGSPTFVRKRHAAHLAELEAMVAPPVMLDAPCPARPRRVVTPAG